VSFNSSLLNELGCYEIAHITEDFGGFFTAHLAYGSVACIASSASEYGSEPSGYIEAVNFCQLSRRTVLQEVVHTECRGEYLDLREGKWQQDRAVILHSLKLVYDTQNKHVISQFGAF
jgi:hypothetical protein